MIEGLVQIQGSEEPIPSGTVPSIPSDTGDMAMSKNEQLLAAGEAVDVSTQGKVSRREAVSPLQVIAWRQRRLVFEGSSLGDIAAEFNRYNSTVKIRVIGEAAVNKEFSGTFNADDPEALMQALDGDAQVRVERSGEDIVIRERGG